MFKNCVSSTLLTGDAANIFFSNITGDSYGGDVTFLASIRALVAPRMPDGDKIRIRFGRSDYSASAISGSPARDVVTSICSDIGYENGQILVHSFSSRDNASTTAAFELIKSKFTTVYEGYSRLDIITDFYKKSFKVLCFIDPSKKRTVLFVEQLNLQKLHYLQRAIFAFLPWYFNREDGMSVDEKALIDSLRERTPDAYLECIKKIAGGYDFETARIKQLLSGFEIKFERMECDRVRREIANVDNQIRDLDSRFARCISTRNDLCIKLSGLELKVSSGESESEIMEYFLCNRKLVLEEVTDTKMRFAVRDYLTYFEEDAAQSYINNDNSYFYRICSDGAGHISKSSMRKLLTAIFVDQSIRLKFCAAYEFDLSGSVYACEGHNFSDPLFDGYKPNPHINRYSCIGNYKREINNALVKHDYITALEQCIASAKSLNFHDSTVMEYFVNEFTRNGGSYFKCVELPDGRVVSPKEAIAWIEGVEQTEAKNHKDESSQMSAGAAPVPADLPF